MARGGRPGAAALIRHPRRADTCRGCSGTGDARRRTRGGWIRLKPPTYSQHEAQYPKSTNASHSQSPRPVRDLIPPNLTTLARTLETKIHSEDFYGCPLSSGPVIRLCSSATTPRSAPSAVAAVAAMKADASCRRRRRRRRRRKRFQRALVSSLEPAQRGRSRAELTSATAVNDSYASELIADQLGEENY